MRPDDVREWTAEDWAALRAEHDLTPAREWSAAEERAYTHGRLWQLDAHFNRSYGRLVSLIPAKMPFG